VDQRPQYAPPRPARGQALPAGCLLVGVAGVIVLGVVLFNRGSGRKDEAGGAKDQPAFAEVQQPPRTTDGPTPKAAAPGETVAAGPTTSAARPVPEAPLPRRIGHRLPPSAWSSDWQRAGNVRARVYSVALERVALVADRGGVSESPSPVLVIWVEVENLSSVPKRVRWWQDALSEYAELKTARGVPVGRARFGAGVRVRDMPEQSRDLGPGEPPAAALVIFDPPPEGAGALSLRLDAERVGEAGAFAFTIPARGWK
jgi:hypothetical protein